MKQVILITGFLLALSNWVTAQTNKVMLKTNFSGKVEYGSIDSLISKIQEGKALRIGWQLDFDENGESDLEHWIDADFISILNGHVFNQITPVYRQIPESNIPQMQIINSSIKWTGIIGTNGKLLNRYIVPDIHLIEDESVRKQLEKRAKIKEWTVATIWVIKE